MDSGSYHLTTLHNLRSFNEFFCQSIINKFQVELGFIVVALPVFEFILISS